MFQSIRGRLMIPLGILILCTFGVAAWMAFANSQRASRDVVNRVAGVARTLAGARFPLTESVLRQMKGLTGAELVLVSAEGRSTGTLDPGTTTFPAAAPDESRDPDRVQRVEVGGREYLCESILLRPGHPNAGATLTVFYPKDRFDAEVADAVRPQLIVGVVGAIIAVGMMIGVAHRLTSRLRDLRHQTRRIADGDFQPMPLAANGDEIWDLGRAVNDMAAQLRLFQERMLQSERLRLLDQLSGGLAHQLRNAVAGAKLAVQVHAGDCEGGDAEALAVALRQLSRVEADLAKLLDYGIDRRRRFRPQKIAELAEEAVTLLRPQCQHLGVDLRWEPTATPVVLGDAGRLGHAFVNLINNAIEAAGPGGWVEVGVRQPSRAACIVEVRDSGPGPAAELEARMGEPFVTGRPDGIGLGLFVARQAVEAHGGRLGWRRESASTIFEIELPTCAKTDELVSAAAGIGGSERD